MEITYKTLLAPNVKKTTPRTFLQGYLEALISLQILMETQGDEINGQTLYDTLQAVISQIRRQLAQPCRIE